jgi:hypothetical protein
VTKLVAALFAGFLALAWLPAGAQTQSPAERADKASAAEKKADRKAEREARRADRKANSATEQK